MMALQFLARALGGDVSGGRVLAPGPGHSRKDRSMWVQLSPMAPDGFIAGSFAGDAWQDCKDHIRSRIGLDRQPFDRRRPDPARQSTGTFVVRSGGVLHRYDPPAPAVSPEDQRRIDRALAIWQQGIDPHGTIVETYLRSRCLDLPAEVAGAAIRFHPACPWRGDDGAISRVPAMIALFRDIVTDEPCGIHRTALTQDSSKIGRKMLGRASGAAIKLDVDEHVTLGLTIGEGVETCLAARQMGFVPVWATGSADAIRVFPVFPGINGLTLLAETDKTGANAKAIRECAARWHEARSEALVIDPGDGDCNDAIRRAAH